jgi:hypothetical protein
MVLFPTLNPFACRLLCSAAHIGFFAVYPDGKVCISILHEAKEDAFNAQEQMSEKWRPILGVRALICFHAPSFFARFLILIVFVSCVLAGREHFGVGRLDAVGPELYQPRQH